MGAFAWVTLATNDSYSLGALVLAHSLKQAGTAHQLAVLVTPGVTNAMREKLALVFNVVEEVNILDSRDQENLRLLKRPELGITFTKLHCWRLTQFEKCVFLDADTLMLQNSDELFERDELSAAPDVGWPDCFNSGVYVYRPSLETYEKLIQFALEKGSFDGGDQGLLNLYFSDWAHKDINKHLPFIYNMCSTACYSYLPAFKQFGANAKIIHFIGAQKPWLQYFNTETRKVQPSGDSSHLQEVLQRWWDIFCSLIYPQLSPAMAGLAGAFAQLTLGVARTPQQDSLENILRKQAWEVGNIDYLGRDSFDNIWSQISKTLSVVQSQAPAPAPEPEVPAAPAAIQSQTAPQEEAICFEPLVLPTDTPTDIVSSIDTSIKSSPPAEPKKEIYQASESLIIAPEVPVTSTTEVADPASNIEVPTPDVCQIPSQKTPVAEPLICPGKEVATEDIAPEPTPVPANLPYETDNVLTEKVVEQQHISFPESQKPITPVATSQSSAATETPVISATKTEDSQIPAKLKIATPEFDSAKPSAEPFTTTSSAVAPTPTSDVGKPTVMDTESEVSAATEAPIISATKTEDSQSPAKLDIATPELDSAKPSAESFTTFSSAVAPTLTSDVGKPAVIDTEPEVSAATEAPVISATKTEDSQSPAKLDIGTPEFDSSKTSTEPCITTASAVAPTLTSAVGKPAVMDTESEVSKVAATETPAVISATKTEDPQIPAKRDTATPEYDSDKPPAEAFTTTSSTVAPTLTSAVGKPEVMKTESEVSKEAVAPPAISTLKEVAIPAAEKAEADKPSSKAAVKDPKLDFAKPAVSGAATKSSPKTKVTAATPPASPGTPPVEKTKRALTAETKIPDTPPPSAAGSTPTPPPRKTDKPKKAAAKPKK